jgi:hypothetical protein
MTRFSLAALTFLVALISPAAAQDRLTFSGAVRSITGQIEPAEARPGQTVTYKLTVSLNPGHLTYPTVQPDQRERQSQNKIQLPADGDLIFVEPVADPADAKTKSGSKAGQTLAYYPGGATWEVKAVVSPKAAPGEKTVALKQFSVLICNDAGNCLPPKAVPVKAAVTVSGNPVPVEEKYRAKVDAALGGPPAPAPKDGSPKTPTPP